MPLSKFDGNAPFLRALPGDCSCVFRVPTQRALEITVKGFFFWPSLSINLFSPSLVSQQLWSRNARNNGTGSRLEMGSVGGRRGERSLVALGTHPASLISDTQRELT